MIKPGETLPKDLRTALSIFLKHTDYHVISTKEGTQSAYTIRNMMQGVANITENNEATAQLLLDYGLEKATDHIEKLKKAKEVIEKYTRNKEVAA